jgi:hypothetical protein
LNIYPESSMISNNLSVCPYLLTFCMVKLRENRKIIIFHLIVLNLLRCKAIFAVEILRDTLPLEQ